MDQEEASCPKVDLVELGQKGRSYSDKAGKKTNDTYLHSHSTVAHKQGIYSIRT
jgi:hypothetical protein